MIGFCPHCSRDVGPEAVAMRMFVLILALLLAACSPSGGGRATEPDPTPEPTPTPPPWSLDVKSVKYTDKVRISGTIVVTAVIENTGTAANPSIEFQFNGIEDHMELDDCTPECTVDEGFAGTLAVFPGLKAGAEKTYKIRFIPTDTGAAGWDLCIYDDESGGEQVYCGEGRVSIRQ